jgi:RNA polymerase sigma factor (sigma-70 family)
MGTQISHPRLETAYAELAPRLQRVVGRNVRAPEWLIEEACQTAWSRWLVHRDGIAPGSTLGWLATTAIREALRLLKLQSRHVSLDDPAQAGGQVVELPVRAPGPEQLAEFRDRLAEVRRLPVRQQTVVWMQGFGYDYREIAARTGSTRRTVDRQLSQARRRLFDAG